MDDWFLPVLGSGIGAEVIPQFDVRQRTDRIPFSLQSGSSEISEGGVAVETEKCRLSDPA